VQLAALEAKRLTELAQNHANIDYMNAKATMNISEAVLEGKVNTTIMPYDFKGMINIK